MTDAMIKKRCNELADAHYFSKSTSIGLMDFLQILYRAAYADGQRDRMKQVSQWGAPPHGW